MAIDVRSEVRPLKKVLLQRPGRELEQLVPNSMERLLFDDIPYLRGAQTEHDRFAQVLRDSGVEVVYLTDLAAETLALSDSLRRRFVEDFIRSSGRQLPRGPHGASAGLPQHARAHPQDHDGRPLRRAAPAPEPLAGLPAQRPHALRA